MVSPPAREEKVKQYPIPWETLDFLYDLRADLNELKWEALAGRVDHDRLLVTIEKVNKLSVNHEAQARMNMKLEGLVHEFTKETEIRT